MRSPCHECKLSKADKNDRICMECDKRVNYVAALGEFPDGPEMEKRRDVMATARKKGTCVNCERPDMYLPAFGRCYLCYDVVRKANKAGATSEEIQAALAKGRERIKSGVNLKSRKGTKKLRQAAADIMAEETKNILEEAPGWVVPSVRGVCLEFMDDSDKGMFDWLRERADESRRNPEQQIMWILQHYIEAEKGLDDAGKLTPEP